MSLDDRRVPICCACFRALTSDERNYYESRCEPCESKLLERMRLWRDGGHDWEFDQLFRIGG